MEWISVKDGLPPLNKIILVIDKDNEMWVSVLTEWKDFHDRTRIDFFLKTTAETFGCCGCDDPSISDVTHWMSLPPEPKES